MLSYSNNKFTQIMNQTNWHKGEIVHVPRKSSEISSGMKSYEHFISSRYVCIREEDGDQSGILLKVLGKITSDSIMLKGGEPFCKDDKEEAFSSDIYYSYRFPSEVELKEVLHMIRNDQCLIDKLEEASMHINPNSTFWVRDTARSVLLQKKLQYHDVPSGKLIAGSNDGEVHYRLTIAYFRKSQISC